MTPLQFLQYYLIVGAVTVGVDVWFNGDDLTEQTHNYPPFSPGVVYAVMVIGGVVIWPTIVRDWFRDE